MLSGDLNGEYHISLWNVMKRLTNARAYASLFKYGGKK